MDTKSDIEDAASEFMTAAEVAARLRIGVSTVYAWVNSGRIPCLKFNGIVRFSRPQLTTWIQQYSTCPSASSDQVPEPVSGARSRPQTHRTMGEAAARARRRLILSKDPIHQDDRH